MATSAAEGSIRKTRSTGDIPRVPERAVLHPESLTTRISDARPIRHDTWPANQPPSPSIPLPRQSVSPSSVPLPPLPHSPSSIASSTLQERQNPPPLPPLAQRMRPDIPQERRNNARPAPRTGSIYMRVLLYLGLGRNASQARKAFVSLIWTSCWYIAQVIAIITILVLTGVHFKSPSSHSLSEWKACDRPLGAWASIWVVRVVLAWVLAIWEYQRGRQSRAFRADVEATNGRPSHAGADRRNDHNAVPRQASTLNGPPSANSANETPENPPLAWSGLYSRLTIVSSLLTLSWFLTAHILQYSSINTCRHTSPHLWWLTFGIICIMYFMVLEVVLLGIVVLIIAPILFIFWNIFLMCLGRHPLQNPHMIKPEIGGLPKSVVERIPLVMYIPPPPEDEKNDIPRVPHVYPPKIVEELRPPQQKRFKLLRSFRSKRPQQSDTLDIEKDNSLTMKEDIGKHEDEPISWEDNWERNDYPFVALEGNRAACAICLLDFEAPKRKHPLPSEDETKPEETEVTTAAEAENVASGSNSPTQLQPPNIREENRPEALKLEDAGEGAQPLRLLQCSHVFHKTCLDPWLIDVSGRCPICQRAVEVPKPTKKSRRRAT